LKKENDREETFPEPGYSLQASAIAGSMVRFWDDDAWVVSLDIELGLFMAGP
jgi:hypothetical protein